MMVISTRDSKSSLLNMSKLVNDQFNGYWKKADVFSDLTLRLDDDNGGEEFKVHRTVVSAALGLLHRTLAASSLDIEVEVILPYSSEVVNNFIELIYNGQTTCDKEAAVLDLEEMLRNLKFNWSGGLNSPMGFDTGDDPLASFSLCDQDDEEEEEENEDTSYDVKPVKPQEVRVFRSSTRKPVKKSRVKDRRRRRKVKVKSERRSRDDRAYIGDRIKSLKKSRVKDRRRRRKVKVKSERRSRDDRSYIGDRIKSPNSSDGGAAANHLSKPRQRLLFESMTNNSRIWHSCDLCGLVYKRGYQLRYHGYWSHEGVRRCVPCGVSFTHELHMKKHIQICEFRPRCEVCRFRCWNQDQLAAHQLEVHKFGEGKTPGGRPELRAKPADASPGWKKRSKPPGFPTPLFGESINELASNYADQCEQKYEGRVAGENASEPNADGFSQPLAVNIKEENMSQNGQPFDESEKPSKSKMILKTRRDPKMGRPWARKAVVENGDKKAARSSEIVRECDTCDAVLVGSERNWHDQWCRYKVRNCEPCGEDFPHPRKLHVHLKKCPVALKCESCMFRTFSPPHLNEHIQRRHAFTGSAGGAGGTCDVCGKRTIEPQDALTHRQLHDGVAPLYKCTGLDNNCFKAYYYFRTALYHMKDTKHCGNESGAQISPLLISSFAIRSSRDKTRTCMVIPSPLFSPAGKKQQFIQKDGAIFYYCESCNELLTNLEMFKVHFLWKHYGFRKCTKCDVTFANSGEVFNHVQTCYFYLQCDVCKITSSSFTDLQHHMLTHIQKGDLFACDFCPATFKFECFLKNHMTLHTGEKPFTCEVCNKKCRTKGALSSHMEYHLGNRKFSCTYCEKSFVGKADLQRHIWLHEGVKQFRCEKCGHQFTLKGSLTKHLAHCTGGSAKAPSQESSLSYIEDLRNPAAPPRASGSGKSAAQATHQAISFIENLRNPHRRTTFTDL